jgi:signal transduction histidine kinase
MNVYRRSIYVLETARRAAEESMAFKSDFINGVSHEIRGPLTNINGFAELMATQPIDEATVRDYAGTIQRAGLHLERIVGQLLDAEKAVAGKMVLHLEPVDLVNVLKLAVKIHSAEAARKNNVLDLRFDTAMPQTVMLDAMRFSQVVYNLLNNAIKFTEDGSVTLTACFQDGRLTVSVRDSGPGILPRYQEGIFEHLRQGDPLLSRIHGGTGIGLSLCKSLVELMAGRIWFETRVNSGSTFFFEIPLQVCESGQCLPAETPVAA